MQSDLNSGCMNLWLLQKLSTLVIPLFWVVQGILVIPELDAAAKHRGSDLRFLKKQKNTGNTEESMGKNWQMIEDCWLVFVLNVLYAMRQTS